MRTRLTFIFISLVALLQAQLPTASISSTSLSCYGACTAGATVVAGGSGPFSYFWVPSGGTGTVASNLCSGSYTCIVTDMNGRTVTAVANVFPPPPISITFTAVAKTCLNLTPAATVLVSGGTSPLSFSWTGGGGNSSVLNNPLPKAYTVSVVDGNSCQATASVNLGDTLPPPLIVTAPSTVCMQTGYTLSASGAGSYSWSNGSNATTISATYTAAPTSYTTSVSVSGTGAVNGCTAAVTKTILVSTGPTITANAPVGVCMYNTVTLTASGAPIFIWSGYPPGPTAAVVPVSTSNSYTVYGADAAGCINSYVLTFSAIPSLSISVNSGSVCSGAGFVINRTVSGAITGSNTTTFAGPNGTVTGASGSYTAAQTSNTQYTVFMSFQNGCNSNSAISTISVAPAPTVTAITPSVCAGIQATIAPQGAVTYTIQNPFFNGFKITGTGTNGCVSDTLNITAVTYPSPVISATGGTVCAGDSFTFQPSGGATYSVTGNSLTVTPVSNTTYTISGANAQGCTSTVNAVVTVSVIARPVVSANSGTLCAGSSFTIMPTGASSYSVSGGLPVVSPVVTTTYAVTGSSAGCLSSNAAVVTVSVLPLPVINVSNGTVCAGSTYTIVPSGATSYTFSAGSATVSPAVTSTYAVSGSSAGCVSASAAVVIVTAVPLPVISAAGGTICAGKNFVVMASGAVSYSITGGSFIVSPPSSTFYIVNGTGPSGCISSPGHSVFVTVNALPVLVITGDTAVCMGRPSTITASGANSYTWNNTFSVNPFVTAPTTSTVYTLSGTGTNGCVNSRSVQVTVYNLPVMQVSATPSLICAGETVLLTTTGAASVLWSNGNASFTNTVTASSTTVFVVTGTSNNGCKDSVSVKVMVEPCTGVKSEERENTMAVFPNPSAGYFTIRLVEAADITVSDVQGRLILSMHAAAGITAVDLNQFTSGLYLVKASSVRGAMYVRILKE
jgi:hypothetical protein